MDALSRLLTLYPMRTAQSARAVGAIGEAVGYQYEAAFDRVFKRSFGIGPGQYRRNAKSLSAPASATADGGA